MLKAQLPQNSCDFKLKSDASDEPSDRRSRWGDSKKITDPIDHVC
jgi:hypothetical protein